MRIAFTPRTATRLVVCTVLGALIADLFLLDHWGISGQVEDDYGRAVPGALILAEFVGQSPVVLLPVPPDPPSRRELCMESRIVETDEFGNFSLSVLTRNRFMTGKSAHLLVYKPGFNTHSLSVSISSSLFLRAPSYNIKLTRATNSRNESTWSQNIMDRMQPLEVTYADSLLASTFVVTEGISACGRAGLPLAIRAMQYSIESASTFDERDRARSACGFARQRLQHYEYGLEQWPFDCDNLPFKHQPSPEVFAVEAELAAKRKAAAERNSAEGGSSSASTSPHK